MTSRNLSLRDNAILQAFANGLSPEEVEKKFGIPAAEAVIRTREILRSRDIWSQIEQRQLLLEDLQRLKVSLMDKANDAEDAAWASVLLRTLKEIGNILDKQTRFSDEDIERVTSAQMKVLLNLVVTAFGAAKAALERDYPDVDVQEIEDVFNLKLLEASREE